MYPKFGQIKYCEAEWLSGLKRMTRNHISSDACVRITPLSFYFCFFDLFFLILMVGMPPVIVHFHFHFVFGNARDFEFIWVLHSLAGKEIREQLRIFCPDSGDSQRHNMG